MNELQTQTRDWRQWTRRELDGEWICPDVTEHMRAVAAQELSDFQHRFLPPKPGIVVRWLNSLGILTAGRISAEDAELKVGAYASILDFPSGCYTQHSLKRAAETFKFWPSMAELTELLKDEERRIHVDKHRLSIIAKPPEKKPEVKTVDRSDEAIARWNASLADALGHVKVKK